MGKDCLFSSRREGILKLRAFFGVLNLKIQWNQSPLDNEDMETQYLGSSGLGFCQANGSKMKECSGEEKVRSL